MIPFNFHHLYYFYTIAKIGSISKASETLHVGQPALSSQLKQFENYLNLKLFEREGRKITLTEGGRYVLSYAAEIFDVGMELMDGLGDRSQKGRLKIQIGISSFIPRTAVAALLNFLLKIEPEVYISVHEDKTELLIENLKTHLLDLVLTDTPAQSIIQKEIENHLVAKIPVVFCACRALARKYKRLPKDLDGAPVLLPTTQSQVYQAVQEYFITHKIKPKIIGEIQDIELVRRLVLDGAGIAPLNILTVTRGPSKEPLVILNKESRYNIFDNIYLLTKKRKKKHPLIPKIIDQFKLPV